MLKPTVLRRAAQLLLASLLIALAFSASTAHACGCGIYIPSEGEVEVAHERSLVRWDGAREDIILSLGVLGSSPEAAIILPIPSPAEVQLGKRALFDELDELTKPLVREETEWVLNPSLGGSAMPPEAVGAGAPPVTVLSRQNVGPFDVANLSAKDADALQNWLDENGFQLDPQIAEILQPYIDEQWTFVAVRLQPEQQSGELGGTLDPLWLSFDSDELVYPMRASAHADNSQALDLYILAEHRVDKENAFGASHVAYADWVDPAALGSGSALAPLVPRKLFLTKYLDTVNPDQVNDDFHLNFAPQDTTYRDVKIVRVQQDATWIVLLACVGLMGAAVVAFFAFLILIARRRAARPVPTTATPFVAPPNHLTT